MTSPDTPNISAVFGHVDREIWIVTAADGERRGGLVATWVSQASIDPETPVVAIAIAVNHFTRELIDASRAFALHLIAEEQIGLAWRFGLESGRQQDKLAGLDWQCRESGSPVLADSLAWLDCRVFDRYDGGDRIYYWADVLAGAEIAGGKVLREKALFEAASPRQRQQLEACLAADLEVQRPLYAAWRTGKSFD